MKTPRVALLVETSREYGRGLLRGIIRYQRKHGPWSITFQPHGLGEPPPPWLRTWKGDGIIARINDVATAEALMRLKVPLIDLRASLPGLNLPIVGIDNGIMLSSGDIASVVGPNASDSTSTINNTAGDAQLDALTTSPTFDGSTLEFDFTCGNGGQIAFQYVFSSEEYNEWVNSQYNDVFAFFLNGVNIAVGTPIMW